MSDDPAKRAAALGRDVADMRHCLADQRGEGADVGRAPDGDLARGRADRERAVQLDAVESWDAADVDEDPGLCEPHVHQRKQALSSGYDLRLVPMLSEQAQSLVEALWREVLKACWFHAPSAPTRRRRSPSTHDALLS